MGKLDVANFCKGIGMAVKKHSPEILTGIGIAGMLATTILAVKATPKAIEAIKADSEENHDGDPNAYTKKEAIKSAWKCYIPAAVTGVSSTACLIGASSVNARRNAALVTAYNVTRTALTEYKDKVVETIGEKKEHVIRESIAKDKLEKDPVTSREVIVTDKTTTLCYDGIFGRYFLSDIDSINRAINEINRRVVSYGYVSLNEFYEEIGLEPTGIGEDLGWSIDDGQVEIVKSAQLASDGRPCLVIEYSVAPKYGYDKYM